MSENFNSHIACEGTDNDINWVCKVCKDLPNYAGMYLYQREREKNQLKNVKDRRADLILLKYYYALLHLLDKIHELHECPNPENDVPKYADRKCSTPECFVYYRYIYNTYASILMTEKGLNQINLRCDICSVLPYTIFSDLEMIAKNMHSDDMEKTQKLEIEAVIADYYLEAVGSCEQWDECPSGVDWLELIKSVQLLRKYLEKKDRKELQISLNEWNRVRSIDNILNTEIKTTYAKSIDKISFSAGRRACYNEIFSFLYPMAGAQPFYCLGVKLTFRTVNGFVKICRRVSQMMYMEADFQFM